MLLFVIICAYFLSQLVTTSCTAQTCSSKNTQLAKPFISLYNVGVVFGEHEDSWSNKSDDQSDSEECF